MRRLLLMFMLIAGVSLLHASTAQAVGLKVAPLEYRTTLDKGEKQKGFVDISNPSNEKLRVNASVQAFRQTDDEGTLQFFDDEQFAAGVQLDLDEFDLGPREAVRMYFVVDGSRLPPGDIFGAIFFSTALDDSAPGTKQSVRLGSLLSITNGTPGSRQGAVTDLSVPLFQFGDTVSGKYWFKNTGDKGDSTGFYPTVSLKVQPFGESKLQTGKLTFAGITRANEFSLKSLPLGVYRVSALYQGGVGVSRWVVVISPTAVVWLAIIALFASIVYRVRRRGRRMKMGRS